MTQCYDMHESVSIYTNYNHYESTILELSLILRNQVTTETEPGDTVALTAAKRSSR